MRIQVEVLTPVEPSPPQELLDGIRSCPQVGQVRVRGAEARSTGSSVPRLEVLYLSPRTPDEQQIDGVARDETAALIVASEEHRRALLAFQLGAVDFLHLPAGVGRIEVAVERAVDRLTDATGQLEVLLRDLLDQVGHSDTAGSLVCNSGDKLIFIPLDDVLWIESSRNTARIHTSDQIYWKRISLAQLEERLPSHFWRLHRSAIVNTHRLARIESTRSATSHAILDDGTPVEVSRRHRLRQIRPLLV
ncbi:MAG: LytTR family transcriptional regulator DNA-binding domain-containing protein [Thermoanaerobaculia bacterium]|nr:LytTR family transcriptional regulator DNA-binding domain-containing protein [Thermoanaerobaculia bacterium]